MSGTSPPPTAELIPRVLLVEDDPDVRETTALVLQRHGFDVRTAPDGRAGEELFGQESFHVAVVDVAMPVVDGLTLTRRLRRHSTVPILLLTARDLAGDVVSGLDAGADDYVTKPFDGEVLAARLRALIRRAHGAPGRVDVLGEVTVDRAGRVVRRGQDLLALSTTEFRLLEAFLDHPGQVLSRAQLLGLVWSNDEWTDERVVDTYVQRVRAKIGAAPIETVRGFGYKLLPDAGAGR